jgi:hypothetical protein
VNDNRFIDLSHAIENGMITYKGLPAPIVCDFSCKQSRSVYAPGIEFHVCRKRIPVLSVSPATAHARITGGES